MLVVSGGGDGLRLLEPLAALSVVTDLAHGRPTDQALRAALLAVRVSEQLSAPAATGRDALYVTLMRSLGCTATSHEYAIALGGDDIAVRREGDAIDPTRPSEAMSFVRGVARSRPATHRLSVYASGLIQGRRVAVDGARADCEVARQLAVRLRLGADVTTALYQGFERWDGRGHPEGLRGENILASARIAAAASAAVMFRKSLGDDCRAVLRAWSGRALDPAAVAAVLDVWSQESRANGHAAAETWTGEEAGEDPLLSLLDAETPVRNVAEDELDAVAEAFSSLADLKATHLHGHSSGVARLASRAAELVGEDATAITNIRRAALLHDLGRVAIPTGIWERPGRLTSTEWELVRLHAYQTERILARSTALAPLGRIAGLHHERLDGSGYHRGCRAVDQDRAARILAAADMYHALIEVRPHRPAHSADAAARVTRDAALDHDAVEAVLEAAGHVRRRDRTRPAGLTEREVDVLRLMVRGLSMKQAARELFISVSTVHTHLAHVYEKAGVSTRAAAAVFAMENDLLEP